MIPYGHQSITKDDIRAVSRALTSEWLTQGPTVVSFEEALAKRCGTAYAVAFSSGTAALHAAYFVADIGEGDEFITSALTFVATANAGLYLSALPVFADIDENGNLDPREVEKKITSRTKAIVVVDYAGRPAQLQELQAIAKNHRLILIEDAAHALGASYKGKPIGSIADLTIFSFHPVKSITTGEGGAVLTSSKAYYDRLKQFGNHGITKDPATFKNKSDGDWYHEMQSLGFNYRLTDIQATLGLTQLAKLDQFIQKRRALALRYSKKLAKLRDVLECPRESNESAWHLYPIRLKGKALSQKATIFKKLRAAGVGVQVHYIPVYLQPYYQELGYKKGMCPNAERFYQAEISLPIFPKLTLKEQDFVVHTLSQILKHTQ